MWHKDFNQVFSTQDERMEYFKHITCPHPFASWEWMEVYAGYAVKNQSQLRLLSIYRDKELIALIPFQLRTEMQLGMRLRTLRLLGDPLADLYSFPRCDAPFMHTLLNALYSKPPIWDVVILSELTPDAYGDSLLRQCIDESARPWHRRHASRSPILNVPRQTEHPPTYSKSLGTRLKRARAKLANAGQAHFRQISPRPHEVDRHMYIIKSIEDASWKGRSSQGICSTTVKYTFFRELAYRFAQNGWLDIWYLELNNQVISYRFGFRHNKVFYDYNLAYLPEFAHLSPGRVLLDEIILRAPQHQLERIDASRGSLHDPHLLTDWSKQYRDHFRWWLFMPTLSGKTLALMLNTIRPIARRIFKRTPVVSH